MKLFKPFTHMLLHVPSEKVFISRFAERKSRKQDCSLSDAGICNAIRSYEKRKVSNLTADAPRGPKNALAQTPCPRRTQTCKQVTVTL